MNNRLARRIAAGVQIVEAQWTTAELWEKLAKRCAQVLDKSNRVRAIGSLHTRFDPDA